MQFEHSNPRARSMSNNSFSMHRRYLYKSAFDSKNTFCVKVVNAFIFICNATTTTKQVYNGLQPWSKVPWGQTLSAGLTFLSWAWASSRVSVRNNVNKPLATISQLALYRMRGKPCQTRIFHCPIVGLFGNLLRTHCGILFWTECASVRYWAKGSSFFLFLRRGNL